MMGVWVICGFLLQNSLAQLWVLLHCYPQNVEDQVDVVAKGMKISSIYEEDEAPKLWSWLETGFWVFLFQSCKKFMQREKKWQP